MSTHEYHEDPEALEASMKARYELRDANFNSVGKWINGFFIFTAFCLGISFLAMLLIHTMFTQIDRPVTSTVITAPDDLPAKAPLQNNITAWKDMQDLRLREKEQTTTFGEGANEGRVRIPVERAMELMAEKGRQGVAGSSNAPATTSPGAPN